MPDCKEEDKKKRVNLINKDSVMVEKENKYFQGYNCQAAVNEHGIIVDNDVINNASDRQQCKDMVKKTVERLSISNVGEKELKNINFIMDKGYHNSGDIGELTRAGISVLIPFHEKKNIL